MRVIVRKLKDARQTGRLMRVMADYFTMDMAKYASLSYPEFFEVMKNIPFNPDPDEKEVLKRPMYTMNQIGPGGDCDDKAIAVLAWAKLVGIPARIVGVGRRNPNKPKKARILLSHVYPELYIWNDWIPFDATYGFNILGKTLQDYDRKEIL